MDWTWAGEPTGTVIPIEGGRPAVHDPSEPVRRMRVLVAVGSRHGATAQIATRVADRLRRCGHQCEVIDVAHEHHGPDATDGFDAFVIGSAVYEGRWLRGARHFVLDHAIEMQRAPVWLFSSGPLGDDDRHVSIDTRRIDELIHAVDAREHRVFAGKLARDDLGRLERWIVDIVHAREGDHRRWEVIDAWADGIADALRA
jgi:menaquinone-dependent protoporphyrinogen oxidase